MKVVGFIIGLVLDIIVTLITYPIGVKYGLPIWIYGEQIGSDYFALVGTAICGMGFIGPTLVLIFMIAVIDTSDS